MDTSFWFFSGCSFRRSFRSIQDIDSWCILHRLVFLNVLWVTVVIVGTDGAGIGFDLFPLFIWNLNEIFFLIFGIQSSLLGRSSGFSARTWSGRRLEIKAATDVFQTGFHGFLNDYRFYNKANSIIWTSREYRQTVSSKVGRPSLNFLNNKSTGIRN